MNIRARKENMSEKKNPVLYIRKKSGMHDNSGFLIMQGP